MLKLEQLEKSLARKESEAKIAKTKGMNTKYGNCLLDISELKRKIVQLNSQSRNYTTNNRY